MVVFLVPLGRGRYDLYSEPAGDEAPGEAAGAFGRLAERVRARWAELVHAAHGPDAPRGRLARWRDAAVRRIAESMQEQRTLWGLRRVPWAALAYPADLDASSACAIRDEALRGLARHHLRWLIVDALLFALSGVLVLVPGPNLVAYYFALRLIGHCLSWRGAVHALGRVAWTLRAETALAELRPLADAPCETRAAGVADIAARLELTRFAAFFDRAAATAS